VQELQVYVLHLAVPDAGLQGHHGGQRYNLGSDMSVLGRSSQGLPDESAEYKAK
jgi:hypothetical protein